MIPSAAAPSEPLPATSSSLTSTQLGRAAEMLVSVQLMLASGGRLSPFPGLADDHGVDLIVRDKLTRRTLTLQVKARVASEPWTMPTLQFDVRAATFCAESGAFLLAVVLDLAAGTTKCGWLIPHAELEAVVTNKGDRLILTPNPRRSSQDRYAAHRFDKMSEVARWLTAYLDRMTT